PGEVVSRYEAPRGENIHYIKSNGTDKPERLKVRAPTLANYPATIYMLKNGFIADIPLIFAAIDPCICCAERVIQIDDIKTKKTKIMTMAELRKWSIEFYKKNPPKKEVIWPL
ncbi:MAG: NADH dehydrogenase subunit, partial [candidate division WOR-3 bacterium]